MPADCFFVRVGNERGAAALCTVPLTEVLYDLEPLRLARPGHCRPATGPRLDLRADRDTHFLVSAQAVFLPIPREGKAEFNPVLFNYQSAPDRPAVLAILATREGTSMAVIENRPGRTPRCRARARSSTSTTAGQRAALIAERRSDVKARILAQGGPRTEADRSALGRGADVMALIQVPLVHENRGVLGGVLPDSGESGYTYSFSDDPLAAGGFGPNDATIRVRPGMVRDLERAVLGHGPRLGPFEEGRGARLVRDPKFPDPHHGAVLQGDEQRRGQRRPISTASRGASPAPTRTPTTSARWCSPRAIARGPPPGRRCRASGSPGEDHATPNPAPAWCGTSSSPRHTPPRFTPRRRCSAQRQARSAGAGQRSRAAARRPQSIGAIG